MRFEDLPKIIAIVGRPVSDPSHLAQDLAFAVCDESRIFTHWEPISGAARSGRILYQQMGGEAVPFRQLMTPEMVSEELLRLSSEEARYSPDEMPGYKKGWQVSYALIDRRRVAIVWAQWA